MQADRCHLKKLSSYCQIKISKYQKSLKLLVPRVADQACICWVVTESQPLAHHWTLLGLDSITAISSQLIMIFSSPSHKHVAYPSKATRVVSAINYGQQLCGSVPIRARAPQVADPNSLSGDYNKHVHVFATGQRLDGIYIISCFVVDHYYTRLGRCSLFMLLSLNNFPLVSPPLCLGRSHLVDVDVGVDALWHEEQRNQTPINSCTDIRHPPLK